MTSWLIEHPDFKMKSQKKNQFETKPKKIHKFSSQHTTFPNHHKKDEKKHNKPDKTKSVNRIRHESINLNANRLGETSFQIELFGSRHESCKAKFDAESDINIDLKTQQKDRNWTSHKQMVKQKAQSKKITNLL